MILNMVCIYTELVLDHLNNNLLFTFTAGESWKGKMNRTVMKLKESGADLVVITALDEVAWLFNLVSIQIKTFYLHQN